MPAAANERAAKCFLEIADLLAVQEGDTPRVAAYRRAARTLLALAEPAEAVLAHGEHIPGVGEALAKKIHEIATTGTCAFLERLKAETPAVVPRLLAVRGLGPRRVRAILDAFGDDAARIREAAASGALARTLRLPAALAARIEAALASEGAPD